MGAVRAAHLRAALATTAPFPLKGRARADFGDRSRALTSH
jgi:hypothetical protein